MSEREIHWTIHALQSMFMRNVSHADILEVLERGLLVEDYPTDFPFPSRLLLHSVRGRSLHVVVADGNAGERIIVTVYEPDNVRWLEDFRSRRPK